LQNQDCPFEQLKQIWNNTEIIRRKALLKKGRFDNFGDSKICIRQKNDLPRKYVYTHEEKK